MQSTLRLTTLGLVAAFALAATAQQPVVPSPPPAYAADPKFQKVIEDIRKSPHASPDELAGKWKKAFKISGGQCIECLRNLDGEYLKTHEWKDAIATAVQYAALAQTPQDKFYAAIDAGSAWQFLGGAKPKPEQLTAAHEAYLRALAIAPHQRVALFNDGRILAQMGNDDEARARFNAYVALAKPDDALRIRASHFAENPHLASLQMAPAFSMRTLQGQDFNLDNMQGKVVLLDFWASWCGPCRQTLPEVKRVVEKFAGQPLVVVSISIDKDEKAWQTAMQQNGMAAWPQYRDADGRLSELYDAHSIPRFFTIDTDGVLQSVQVGSDASIEGSLKKLVARAAETQRKLALATDKPAPGQ